MVAELPLSELGAHNECLIPAVLEIQVNPTIPSPMLAKEYTELLLRVATRQNCLSQISSAVLTPLKSYPAQIGTDGCSLAARHQRS
ncbi:hypothetical protein NPIL_589531 [Nephila pilipes]|uniref:Uncharacterized protein n=1 Tax=Nephila pilipes TaxID=299642 RepID=A0A8X6TNX5_NEPPI|nr:hypothetical protein NPIL_589531 [Nephila pilipes]